MVERFFLALDYATADEAVKNGVHALTHLGSRYGGRFVDERVGVKVNQDLLTGPIDARLKMFGNVFADLKISHGADTGERIIRRLQENLPVNYVTVAANLGKELLKRYVEIGNEITKIIAFTVHTKISPEDAARVYNLTGYKQSVSDAVYWLSQLASEAGCDAVVMEARALGDERIRNLPIKKLVTGIRIEPSDKGTQKRVSTLEEVSQMKGQIDYAVISSRYLNDDESLGKMIDALI